MTEIRTETVPLVDGSALRLTVAEPVSAIRGGIVVLHEDRYEESFVSLLDRGRAPRFESFNRGSELYEDAQELDAVERMALAYVRGTSSAATGSSTIMG